jgi:hypothetical protein
MAISFNPMPTSNAGGLFATASDGLVQGEYQFDPVSRQYLAGGYVASTETLGMYGGIAISESIPLSGVAQAIGGSIARASAIANITGFTVATQMHNGIVTQGVVGPGLVTAGMSVQFARLGSKVRLAVKCDPSLVDLDGGLINQQVSWDFNNQVLAPYETTATYALATAAATYNNNGTWTVAITASVATPVGAVGDSINISGITGTGNAYVNGNQTVSSFTSNESFSILVTAPAGAIGTLVATSAQLNYGTGALPVQVLSIVPNSKVVVQSATGAATWVNNGTAALIVL